MADDPTDPPKDPPPDDTLGDAGKKALEEERKARREAEKQTKDLQARLKQLEDKDKSDSEKLGSRVAELEQELAVAQNRAMRFEVAVDKGLTTKQALRLVGDSPDDLNADADDLLASFKPEDPKPEPGGRPKETLRTGTAPTEPERTPEDIRKAIAEIPR